MLVTPTTILVISFAGLAFGVVLTLWGKRGKRIDEHPVCRACRFDLVGRPPGSDRCPECGADLAGRKAIAIGNRKPRQSAIVIGACLAILSMCEMGAWGWNRFNHLQEGDKPTFFVLRDSRSKDASLRSTALKELSRRQQRGELSESQCDAYVDRLSEMLQSADGKAQSDALRLLKDAGPAAERAIPAIVTVFRSADPPRGRILLIGQTRGETAAELLDNLGASGEEASLREVQSGSPEVLKHWLFNENRKVTDETIARLLLHALNSRDVVLSMRADDALGFCSGGFPAGPAIDGLHDPHPRTRQVCLNLLGKLEKRPPFDVLLPLLHDPDADVRDTAEEALMNCHQWTDDPRSEQLLLKMLANPKDKRRLQAAESLGYYKTQESARALALALKDHDQFVSATAGYSLRRIGGEVAVDAIIDILDDLPPDQRRSAELFANEIARGDFKKTPYWQKHEAAKRSL